MVAQLLSLLSCSGLAARDFIRAPAPVELGLLPFPTSDTLLPGETKQVHLYEARFIQLFADSAARHNDCLGAMLFTPSGNVAAITTLLEVEEFRKEEFGVWANLKCVGRVKLSDVKQTDYEYVLGTVEPFTDATGTAIEDDTDGDGNVQTVRELHESVNELSARLRDSEADGKGEAAERVAWGHEVRGEDDEAGESLERLLDKRKDVLLSRGADAPPLSSLSASLAEVWGVGSEEEANRQLLSFAAAATLSPNDRIQALQMSDTTERLSHVACTLREQQRRLAAMLALKGVS